MSRGSAEAWSLAKTSRSLAACSGRTPRVLPVSKNARRPLCLQRVITSACNPWGDRSQRPVVRRALLNSPRHGGMTAAEVIDTDIRLEQVLHRRSVEVGAGLGRRRLVGMREVRRGPGQREERATPSALSGLDVANATVRAAARSTACDRRRSSSSASKMLMSSDGVAALRARISLRNRGCEIRTVIARLAMGFPHGSVLALSNARAWSPATLLR